MTKYSDKSKAYSIQYAKDKLKRVPLSVPMEEYQNFKAACDRRGERVNSVLRDFMKSYAKQAGDK